MIKNVYRQTVEYRNIDMGHDVLQGLDEPMELKTSESREDNACRRRRTLAGCGLKLKSIGWNEKTNVPKGKSDKARGRQKQVR
jgi:hypothetical protein